MFANGRDLSDRFCLVGQNGGGFQLERSTLSVVLLVQEM